MPYFMTDKSPDCAGWATTKDDGEVIGCHENKQNAVDQMVAMSVAEDMQPGGERIDSGPLAVIVDIDGTLISGGRLIQKTYDYVDGMTNTKIFIVTGRNDSTRADTTAELKSLGIKYNRLFMNPGSSAQTPEFKKATAESLLKEFNVILAIDNNPANRKVYRELGITALDVTDVPATPQANRAPAPAKDQIKGSDTNKEGSASGAGGSVDFTPAVETGLRNKVTEHNDKMSKDNKPDYTRTTLGQLKAVYRRGSGAYSTSHRPGITRAQWSMARVNAFLYLLRNGRPENPAYITDFDLLPKGHPKSTRSLDERAINQDAPAYMRAAARRGLAYYADGKGGAGLVDKTIRDARLMADGQVSDDKWIAIAAWIARHLSDLDSPDANPSSDNYPSAGVVAHLLWGSGPSKQQAQRVLDYAKTVSDRVKMDKSNRSQMDKYEVRHAGEWDLLNDRQQEQAENQATVALEYGMYNQSSDADGAHYAPTVDNPFKADGLICNHCVFYNEVNNQCQIVEGNIEPEGVCKLWVIPESHLGFKESMAETVMEMNSKWKSITLNLRSKEGQSMGTTVERRVNNVEFDIRAGNTSSDGMSFTGYAAVFNSPSEPLPFTELIREGAFKRSLKARNEIKLFMNHNTDVVLGSTRSGTLQLSEDSRGLLAHAQLPDTSAGRDLSVLMQRGDVSSMSFGFSVPPKGDSWSQDGATRELHQIRLHEVSIVTGFPAYEATTASVRSLDILAQRTAVDVDALSDAILKLEAGEILDDANADLISEVVSKLRLVKPVDFDSLEIKRKQLDLMAKVFQA